MDVDCCLEDQEKEEEELDPFLKFVEYARSELLSLEGDANGDGDGSTGLGWSWTVSRILKTCIAYSSGVTPAILLSELSQVDQPLSSFLLCLYAMSSVHGPRNGLFRVL